MQGYECYTPNMPDDFLKCRGIVAAWGLGGEPFFFPDHAGYPLGEEHGGATYYMFEVSLVLTISHLIKTFDTKKILNTERFEMTYIIVGS